MLEFRSLTEREKEKKREKKNRFGHNDDYFSLPLVIASLFSRKFEGSRRFPESPEIYQEIS